MTKIKVIDALPGTGKTFAKFEYMKQRPDHKWMFVTPMLDEIDRIQGEVPGEKGCPELNFKAPSSRAKRSEVLALIESGENIACTHALFEDFTLSISPQSSTKVIISYLMKKSTPVVCLLVLLVTFKEWKKSKKLKL